MRPTLVKRKGEVDMYHQQGKGRRRAQVVGWRVAFTLVELLVVIAIIGVLVGLLLPAIQSAREAARRMQCTNNLKQLGLAAQNFYAARGHFPMGYYWPAPPGDMSQINKNGNEATWIVYLLPYLEQNALNDSIDWSLGFGWAMNDRSNYQVVSTPIPALQCPSSPVVELFLDTYARGNYVANNGIGPMTDSMTIDLPIERHIPSHPRMMSRSTAGVFYLNSKTSMRKITDGASNVALFSEIITVPDDDFRGVMYYPEGVFYHHNYTPNSSVPDELRGSFCVNTVDAPCIPAYSNFSPRNLTMTARSYHVGGVNLALADGSVHFVGESVDLDTWQALATPERVYKEAIGSGL